MNKQSRAFKWLKRVGITFLTLFILYVLIGFWGVPLILRHIVLDRMNESVAGYATVEAFRSNPFTWELKIEKLVGHTPDDEVALGFEEFRVRVKPFSFFSEEYVVPEIILDKPMLNLVIDEAGRINIRSSLQQIQEQMEDAAEQQKEENEPLVIPRVHIGTLQVIDASLSCEINSLTRPFKREIVNTSFVMNDLHTGPDYQNPYDFNLQTALGEELKVTGTLKLDPLSSRGEIHLKGLQLEDFQAFVAPLFNFELQGGEVDFSAEYAFKPLADEPSLNITGGTFELRQMALFGPGQDEPFQAVKRLALGGLNIYLLQDRVQLDALQVEGGRLLVVRDAEGVLNLIRYTRSPGDQVAIASQAQAERASGDPREIRLGVLVDNQDVGVALTSAWNQIQELVNVQWDLEIGSVDVTDQSITWRDQFLDRPAELRLSAIELKATDLTNRAENPFPFELSMLINENGSLAMEGTFTPVPPGSAFNYTLKDMPLTAISPYGDAFTPVRLAEGTLSASGQVDIRFGDQTLPELTTQSDLAIDHLKIEWFETHEPFVEWRQLQVSEAKMGSVPLAATIKQVSVSDPQAWVTRLPNGQIKLPLPAEAPSGESAPAPAAQNEAPAEAAPPLDLSLQLDKLSVSNGSVHITDESVLPAARFALRAINLEAQTLSLEADTRTDIDLNFRLAEGPSGRVAVKGAAQVWQPLEATEVSVTTESVTLPAFAPYAVPMLGQPPVSGAMSAQLDYQVKAGVLDGQNNINIDKMRFGPRVKDSKAPNLPLELGVAILEDRQGVMRIDIPVKGDTNDPQFALNNVIQTAITNVVSKLATAPFSILGAVFAGEEGAPAKFVEFDPGEATLTPKASATLGKLGDVLYNRPALNITLTPSIAPVADKAALQEQKFTALLKEKTDQGMSTEAAIDALWKATQSSGAASQGQLSPDLKRKVAVAAIEITPADFQQLADARAKNAQAAIIARENVSAERADIVAAESGQAYAEEGPRVIFGVSVANPNSTSTP